MGGVRREVFATIARSILRQKYQINERTKNFAASSLSIDAANNCFTTI